ncbi:diguanylate cyclase (GGDEF)-like protein [Rhizobium sp. AG855]|nr:diguanylate cyclase (GGDEF)-like protein [Rhizobium sp. AG855]
METESLMPERSRPPLFATLAIPMVGANDKGQPPPWEKLTELYKILPHLFAAAAILCASVLPYSEGRSDKVIVVAVILALQLMMRFAADYRYRRRAEDAEFKHWLLGFVVISLLSGIAWGTSIAILYRGSGPEAQVVVLAVGCGIVQSCAARAYMAPASTVLVILIMIGIFNATALSEDNWLMLPICLAYVAFQASYMTRLVDLEQARAAAERQTDTLVLELAQSNEKLRRANEQLMRHAATDDLTGLANRRSFDASLQTEVDKTTASGASLSLLLLDVDHFKRFNDTFGHLAGDDCLRRVGRMLKEECEARSYSPARYGGEEFAIVMPGASRQEAEIFAAHILAMASALDFPELALPAAALTVSIGLATMDCTDDCVHALINRADQGLYAAKQAGRNCARMIERTNQTDVTA